MLDPEFPADDFEAAREPWFGKQRLAAFFDCSVRSIEMAITEGMPHAIIFGRVKARASEVEAWLDAGGRIERRGTLPTPDERRAA